VTCCAFRGPGYTDGLIQGRAAKAGEPVWMPAHPMLKALLDKAPRKSPIIVIGHAANPIRRMGSSGGFSR